MPIQTTNIRLLVKPHDATEYRDLGACKAIFLHESMGSTVQLYDCTNLILQTAHTAIDAGQFWVWDFTSTADDSGLSAKFHVNGIDIAKNTIHLISSGEVTHKEA